MRTRVAVTTATRARCDYRPCALAAWTDVNRVARTRGIGDKLFMTDVLPRTRAYIVVIERMGMARRASGGKTRIEHRRIVARFIFHLPAAFNARNR